LAACPGFTAAEVPVGGRDVLKDLDAEGFGGVELALGADAAEELDADVLGRGAGEGIEEEGFDGEVGGVAEGGAVADVGDAVPSLRRALDAETR
jgi:hypothetical protein